MKINKLISKIRNKIEPPVSRKKPFGYEDTLASPYGLAGYLGEKFECSNIIDLGCRSGENLVTLRDKFEIIGVDNSEEILKCKNLYNYGNWITFDFEKNANLELPRDVLGKSVIICSNLLERLENSNNVLNIIERFLDYSPICLFTTLDKEKTVLTSEVHINARYNFSEFKKLISSKNFNLSFIGLTFYEKQKFKKNILALIEGNNSILNFRKKSSWSAPNDFKIIAIMTSYNDADIIETSIQNLIEENIDVYLIDNWSTDETLDLAKKFKGKGLIGIESFPKDGPSEYYMWGKLLSRVEEVTQELDADWFIHHDSDEVRKSPWPEVNLKNAIYEVDAAGFNAIDHTLINFRPIDDSFQPGSNFEKHLRFFEFGKTPASFVQIKAWKNLGIPISLANTGGHKVEFVGRKVFPYKFLLKHYPIRSQHHGEKKFVISKCAEWITSKIIKSI